MQKASTNDQERPNVPADERALHDLAKQILKLRWIGMRVEPEQEQVALQTAEARRLNGTELPDFP